MFGSLPIQTCSYLDLIDKAGFLEKTSAKIGQMMMAAALEPSCWDSALREMAFYTGSSRGQLLGMGGQVAVPFNVVTDQMDGATHDYFAVGADRIEVNWRWEMSVTPLKLVHDVHYTEMRRARAPTDFDDYLATYEAYHGCHTTLLCERGTTFALAALRSLNDGEMSETQLERFAEIIPYAHAAVLLQKALEEQGATLIAGALETMSIAAFVLDGLGLVRGHTPAAEALLTSGGRLSLFRNRLTAARPAVQSELDAALSRLLDRSDAIPSVEQLWLPGATDAALPRLCEIFPLPRREWSFGFEPRVLVVIHQAAELRDSASALVARWLDLTPAEADVALYAANGMSREEIAGRRGTSAQTTNSQFKSIFRKADVSRESELVALIHKALR